MNGVRVGGAQAAAASCLSVAEAPIGPLRTHTEAVATSCGPLLSPLLLTYQRMVPSVGKSRGGQSIRRPMSIGILSLHRHGAAPCPLRVARADTSCRSRKQLQSSVGWALGFVTRRWRGVFGRFRRRKPLPTFELGPAGASLDRPSCSRASAAAPLCLPIPISVRIAERCRRQRACNFRPRRRACSRLRLPWLHRRRSRGE